MWFLLAGTVATGVAWVTGYFQGSGTSSPSVEKVLQPKQNTINLIGLSPVQIFLYGAGILVLLWGAGKTLKSFK